MRGTPINQAILYARPTAKASPKAPLSPVPKFPSPVRADPKSEPNANPKADPKNPTLATPSSKVAAKTKRQPKNKRLGVAEDSASLGAQGAETVEESLWEGALKRILLDGPHVMAALKAETWYAPLLHN